jgi:hypothetical protein
MTELHTNSLDPMIHKQFKLVSIRENNGLYGSNVKGINEAIELESMSLAGLITFEEVKPTKNRGSLDGSHTQNVNADLDLHSNQNKGTWVKQEKQDFTRLSVRNINPELNKSFNKSLIDKYGTTKGNVGPELSRIMDQFVKVKTGILNVVETGKTVFNNIFESDLVQVVGNIVNSKLSSALNKLGIGSSKRSSSKTIKPASKGAKADTVLFSLMKSREEYFTFNEYKEFLLHLFGQADDRTVKSDLEVLKTSGKIYLTGKRSLYASETYCFTKNHLYAKHNGIKANKKLFKRFSKVFRGQQETTEKEIHTFIQKLEGFFDHKSLTERLDLLDIKGLIRPIHEGSPAYQVRLG